MKIEAMNQKTAKLRHFGCEPETEKAFAFAANHCDVDLISLDLGSKLPFYIKKTTVNMAVQKGIYFEQITYAPCIRGGKNIIISSEAARALDIRSPLDILNLAHSLESPTNVHGKQLRHLVDLYYITQPRDEIQ
ncbi:Polymerase/histidinol phosphatase-like protein [Obelidium mucronatum]|nr:Polymerase/histidinol phosphatase-like protein [Obelidium mucronatum]